PYGFALWDNVKHELDSMIKEAGHVNAYFPLFIPKSFLAQEAKHVEGFAKECAVVTHTRLKSVDGNVVVDPESKLEEEVIVRPTSETVIWAMYKKWIQSYRDLPLLINQWANVVRWEMRTRLFLRTTEFLWQEGHTAHATAEEAEAETLTILEIYRRLAEEFLAIPVFTGRKSEIEKFAGAEHTYSIEAMMRDKRALQSGTSHNLGQNFAKAFNVTFQNRDNQEELVYATSWGVSTRIIGAIIMAHGDDKGLRLPPKVAPHQVVVIPISRNDEQKESITKFLNPILDELKESSVRTKIDWREESPGFKFNDWEMKGVPIRMEVGPRDIENNQVVLVRRDTGEKSTVQANDIADKVSQMLNDIHDNLFAEAKNFMKSNINLVDSYEEFKKIVNMGGFIRCGWDGTSETELKIKEETGATTRVIPFDENPKNLKCIYTGKPAVHEVIFAKAY
ncbi:MAG: proline--tRNA ligase, partial [Candidatus Marinimicrobia bacterium]|nr:proline--tRNA ligase [Candidatus Neomarinimicrobiota bacterium]